MTPIPIILLTGHLGAGKTTLLNHLLSLPEIQTRNPAMIINEFGTLGVDASRIRPGEWHIYEINKGSLFCSCVKTSFLDTLQQISTDSCPGLVLVEATGVSETRDIETIFSEGPVAGAFRVQANLAVVDAANFTKVAAFQRSARNQVVCADGIIVNKSDLVPPDELTALKNLLTFMNPRARQIDVTHGEAPADFIFSLAHQPAPAPMCDCAPSQIVAAAIETEDALDREQFEEAVADLDYRLLRLKGHIDFGDGVRFVEIAGGTLSEAEPVTGTSRTAFTCIAYDVSRDDLLARFQDCARASCPA